MGPITHSEVKMAEIIKLAEENNAKIVIVDDSSEGSNAIIPLPEPIILPFTKPKELNHCYVCDDVRKSSSQPWSKEYKYKNKR